MNEMVNKVAEAIGAAMGWTAAETRANGPWVARAAIAAMREPTAEMLESANHMTGYSLENAYIEQEWRAMVDAALGKSVARRPAAGQEAKVVNET